MIDEKMLIERLEGESYLTTNDDGETDKFSVQIVELKDIKKIVKDLASEHNNGWIPCKEGIPDDSGEPVMATTINGDLLIAIYEPEDCMWWASDYDGTADVIAWMPLPEPYKEEKGE